MSDLTVAIVIVAIVCAAITKIVIEKKKGVKCIGCPVSETSKKNCGCSNSK